MALGNFDSILVYNDVAIEAPAKFQVSIFFSFSPSNVNVCFYSDVLSDGLSTPTPPTKFLTMPLGEQLFQLFNIVCKGKHPSHIEEGFPRASSFGIVATNSIPVVDLT